MLVALYVTFVVHIFLIICIYIAYKFEHGKKKTTTQDYAFSILNLYAVASRTILPIPLYNLFLAFLVCETGSPIHSEFTCYQGIYYLHFFVALIGFILVVIFSFICALIYMDTYLNSVIPFASPPNKIPLFKLCIKIWLIVYKSFYWDSTFLDQIFVFTLFALYVALLYMRVTNAPFYNLEVFNVCVTYESTLVWFNIYTLTMVIFPTEGMDTLGIFYLIFGIPFLSCLSFKKLAEDQLKIQHQTVADFKTEIYVEIYMNKLLHLINTTDNPES